MRTPRTFGLVRSSVSFKRGSTSTGGTLAMGAWLTMALRELSQWGLFWHVASPSVQTLESHCPHSKRSSDTCKIKTPPFFYIHFLDIILFIT
ncbi:uncharacterized protein ACA1_377250 [Acanthamoeba castellanii str. Neff]|uniref:Uncharacterized protein n=1 Tax=Acanthamoeba castellanii (strain ATCC 30010 / Neff) TaxID=1257118 RepID=L8GU58_ACACF|nr:uncharacterized protein ACA1_377250 [Acanthamoeba castellanii str. Neff]ELR15621.1 hypothetical protein ACA1_377250 [Acanthamoeba castellanii str. Neff]